jgi:SprT protein
MSISTQTDIFNQPNDELSIIINEVNYCFDKADIFFGHNFKRSSCNFKQRGRAAGTAHLQKNEVRFNHFMYSQNPSEFLNTVIPHEVAHIVVFQIYGNSVKPHGREWQAVMLKVYGIQPSRTHTFDVPKPKLSYEYYCICNKHQFTKQRHNRAQKGVEYICKLCRSTLKFKDNIK